jgi:hypothetical protein
VEVHFTQLAVHPHQLPSVDPNSTPETIHSSLIIAAVFCIDVTFLVHVVLSRILHKYMYECTLMVSGVSEYVYILVSSFRTWAAAWVPSSIIALKASASGSEGLVGVGLAVLPVF